MQVLTSALWQEGLMLIRELKRLQLTTGEGIWPPL